MQFTPIHIQDINTLRTLATRTYTNAFAHKNKPGVLEKYVVYAFAKAHLEKQLLAPDSYWYFMQQNDTIIGYLKLNIGNAQTEFQDKNGLEIERIYIDSPYVNQGFGKKAIDFSISEALKLEKNYIWLGVWEENPDAIRFYKRCGFKITGTHHYDMIAEIQTDYIMQYDLT
ncbi:GNAT family N-acetyltransferase [uncultured Dokdonia sp.]|uniref:GNAT family N-acetyltransferase n=1 Tax=uncultured Dokdonia sp. TaxID=575653 RepID=UPI00260DE6CD|nr:GNAT family N-acetyltransferase [uncultured Dokdonia sp.]